MDPERIKKLLSTKDIDINERNHRGITALHEAAIDGNVACLRVLVEYGADINTTDHEGFNALDYAVRGGDFETASFLIHNGACESRIRNGLIGFKSWNNFLKKYISIYLLLVFSASYNLIL